MFTRYTAAALVACLAVSAASADVLTEDFESAGSIPPAGWTIVDSGSGTNALGTGNGGGAGLDIDWTGSVQTSPGTYLVDTGIGFDAREYIEGSFDFFVVEDGNYSSINFIMGAVGDGITGDAGEFINLLIREKTFGARANLFDGAGGGLTTGSDNNWEVATGHWYSLDFSWTPTSGTTGDFVASWSSDTDPYGNESISYSGFTFDAINANFGFGTGRSPGQFDNISITGTAIPEPGSLALLGLGGLLIARRRRD